MTSTAAARPDASPDPPAARYAARRSTPRNRFPPPSSEYRIASAIECGRSVRPSRVTTVSALSTESRRSAGNARPMLGVEIPQLQHAVGALDQLLNACFSFSELLGCQAKELDSLLEQAEGGIEIETLRFELGDDLLQALEIRFEGHFAED